MEIKPNRLINEKSPYLLQHAYNPVDWYAWEEDAFEKARKEDKPIFLSIGYSTCHWCHVMEKESFEDREVAGFMNDTFISIKVDREERPDLDNIYMTVCQMLTGSGGWPMTIIMTPQKVPFFAGTYFPKLSRFGRIGMLELIPRIREAWRTRRDEVSKSANSIINALSTIDMSVTGQKIDGTALEKAYNEFVDRFDIEYGGFGSAPKFPTPHNLMFILRYWNRTGEPRALEMVEKSLKAMRKGGIYDHVGKGFHRYSTDREWLVPHFEKMLYDQAMLSMVYLETYQATADEEYADIAKDIFTYVLRDMTSPMGGFYSAEDADSDGEEGKFYVWKEMELRSILEKDEADLIIKVFNIKESGNFREEASGVLTGSNIFHFKKSLSDIAIELEMPLDELRKKISLIIAKLYEVRETRVKPFKDDKILADWNGLMIAALAMGGRILREEKYTKSAVKSMEFILDHMRLEDGKLLHRYREGSSGIIANVDDYAFLIWGLIELYETTFESRFLKTAVSLNHDMIEHFWDEEHGGFFFTADYGEDLIVRKKEIYDGAIPSGNSVAMLNLIKLARLTGNVELEQRANLIGQTFSQAVIEHPSAYTQFMIGIEFAIGPSYEVVIAGSPDKADTKLMIEALNKQFMPNIVMILRPEGVTSGIENVARYLENYSSMQGRTTAYICQNNSCKTPTTDINELLDYLQK